MHNLSVDELLLKFNYSILFEKYTLYVILFILNYFLIILYTRIYKFTLRHSTDLRRSIDCIAVCNSNDTHNFYSKSLTHNYLLYEPL